MIRGRSACSAATSSSSRELQVEYPDEDRLRFFLGDIRDRDRLIQATRGVDLIIHAAALKQVPACEYNPFEAVQTNIIGAENIVAAAIARTTFRARCCSAPTRRSTPSISTARPSCAPRRSSRRATPRRRLRRALRARPLRQRRRQPRQRRPDLPGAGRDGRLTITDERMTRFWITLRAGGRLRPLRAWR